MKINFPIISAVILLIGLFFYFGIVVPNGECITKTEEKIVRGNSLSGVLENGESVKVLFGFYDCNEVKREDIVVYNYAGNHEPIIKIVKGVPGDNFSFKKSGYGWNILIGNRVVNNSRNQPYLLDEESYKILLLYKNDYQGVIPANTYLILGNLPAGSLDSSRFGLISAEDILGAVAK